MAVQLISAAINSVPSMKEELRNAFEDLQTHSAALSSFNIKWKDLEEHFGSIEESIDTSFKDLLAMEQQKQPGAAAAAALVTVDSQPSDSAAWPELKTLKTLCSNMDGKGLLAFILAHHKDGLDIRSILESALRCAADPGKMVLDAMAGFYGGKTKVDTDDERAVIRRTCLLLLERLAAISPDNKDSVNEGVKKLALEWKTKVRKGADNHQMEGLAVQLLGTFGLASEFDTDEILDILVFIARRKEAIDLCKSLGFEEKIPDLIEKLISKGKQLEAVEFAYAFQLVDKYPPVPLLKAYPDEAKRLAKEIRKKGNHTIQSLNEATNKEIAALRDIIKLVKDHNLQSEYSCVEHEKRIAQLEKHIADRKQAVAAKSKQQQPSTKRRRRAAASADGVMFPHPQQPSGPSAGGVTGTANPFSMAGGTGAAPVSTPLHALSGGPGIGSYAAYVLAGGSGAHSAYGGSRSPMSHLTAGPLSTNLYDKPSGYGYSLPPKYDTSYYAGSHLTYGRN